MLGLVAHGMVRPVYDTSFRSGWERQRDDKYHVRLGDNAIDFLQHHDSDHAEDDMVYW